VEDSRLKAILEAIIYITEEPLSLHQISAAIEQRRSASPRFGAHGGPIRARRPGPDHPEIAGGYRMTTKPEHQ